MKKFTALFLLFSFLMLSGNMFARERRGANLKIRTIDNKQIKGELIAVKETSLLLSEFGKDTSVNIEDITVIVIPKKSKFLTVGLGLVIGGGVGYLTGCVVQGVMGLITWGGISLLGLAVGLARAKDEIIVFPENKNELDQILKRLRSKARVPDYN